MENKVVRQAEQVDVEATVTGLVKQAGEMEAAGTGTAAIKTQDHYQNAAEFLRTLKTKLAYFENLEKELKKPYQEKVKTIGLLFKRPIDMLKAVEAKIKNAMLDYQDRMEAERRAKEAELKAAQEAEAKKLAAKAARTKDADKKAELQAQAEAIKAVETIVATQATKVEGISTVTGYRFEIENEALIPRDYLMPDEVKIGKVVRATAGSLQIPGIKIITYKSVKAGKG